jgi:hypothetical protein
MDWLWAALIGVCGSVVGGVVGGWFVLQAASRQSERDRQNARLDRSHDAAFAILAAVAALGEAVTTWKRQSDQDRWAQLAALFNAYSQAVVVQGVALADPELRDRVKNQTQLTIDFLNVAWKGGTSAPQLADIALQHAGALVEALDAHVNGKELPPYKAPKLASGSGLFGSGLEWR